MAVETGIPGLTIIMVGNGLTTYESYVNQVMPDGSRKQRRDREKHATLKAATIWHRKRQVAANDGVLASNREMRARAKVEREKAARESIGASIDFWLAACEKRVFAREPSLSNAAFGRYQLAGRQVKLLVGERSVAGFTRKDARALFEALEEGGGSNGRPLGVRSVGHARSAIQLAFDKAVEDEIIPANIFVGMKRDLKGKQSAERMPPPVDILRRILAATEAERYRHIHIPTLLAITCGMRMGEILALPWANVDLDAGVLHVRCSLDGTNGAIKVPKTESGKRAVALDEDVVAALRAHRAEQNAWALLCGGRYHRNDLVNPDANGNLRKTGSFSKAYAEFRKSLGVQASFHDLRHSHGSQLIKAGVDAKTVSTRLGHRDVRFTLSRYIHSDAEQDRRAATVMGGVLRAAKDEAAS